MAVVKKMKISSVKRAQHLKQKKKVKKPQNSQQQKAEQKLTNQHQLAKGSKKGKLKKKPEKKIHLEKYEEDDEDIVENVFDIIDEDDLEEFGINEKQSRKRKYQEIPDNLDAKRFEKEYTKQSRKDNAEKKEFVELLPIKSKDGEIISRTTKVEYKPKVAKVIDEEKEEENENGEDVDYEDSDDDVVRGTEPQKDATKKVVSMTDLLIRRHQEIEKQKYRIGIICSGILEKPEDKMKNFSALFELMEECNETGAQNLQTIRKIAMMSIAEVFKDILPEYRVAQVDTKTTTVRKTTFARVTYENTLLQQFKKFLQKLEKITASVTKRGTGGKSPHNVKLAEVAVNCMCDLLVAHPYFNYVQNIAQLLVYMLNCRFPAMRKSVNRCFRTVFSTDKKLDMTLFIVRRINHLIKSKSNAVHVEVVSCLMALKIKNVNLDAEKENELKQKKLESHRQRLLSLSKKEKKRQKKLAVLNKELQETKAEENKQSKHYKLTEIIKMVFTIFFRILKNDPGSQILSACLEGLSEFTHVINLEFFSDLVEVLNGLLETTELGYREQLHCIQTIFVILSGQGEVLNIDPIRFYTHLYKNLLVVNAGKNHDDFIIILKTLNEVLIKRRKNITQQRLLAFSKRILTLSLQLMHNGTLASLGVLKTIMQHTSALDVILDADTSFGSGRYDPELNDPEYCNADCTALYELSLLLRHYHPTVRKLSVHVASGAPISGDGSLPTEIGKLTLEELHTQFDSSQMTFNPTIPVPRTSGPKIKKGKFSYLDQTLKDSCKTKVQPIAGKVASFDFCGEYVKSLESNENL